MGVPINIQDLKRLLSTHPLPKAPAGRTVRTASVLMPFFAKGEEPHLLAVLKTDTEGYPWRNQVAFPGGHVDPGDADALAAGYREIREELNIGPHALEVIGSLGHFITIRDTGIEAFVAFWNGDRSVLQFDPLEISRILDIPVCTLIRTHVEKHFENRIPDVFELLYPFGDGEVVIWGVTARIIHFFLEHLRARVPEWFLPGADFSIDGVFSGSDG